MPSRSDDWTDAPAGSMHPALAEAEVVLVSYKSRAHVETLLTGWPAALRVVVVDNSHNVDRIADLADRFPGVRYVDGGGQGFGRAANAGAFSSTMPVLLFVNPDSRPTESDLVSLVEGVTSDASALLHAATTVGRDGRVEVGVGGWEPTPLRCLVHALGLSRRWPDRGLFAQPHLGEHCDVEWCSGACMAVDAARFVDVGGFDEMFFVYAEDMALGWRARSRGWRAVLREDVVVDHTAGSSGAPSQEMVRLRGASFAYYVGRHHSAGAALVMRILFGLGCVTRGVQRLVAGDVAGVRLNVQIIRGVVTRRAYANGVEVATSRHREVVGATGPGTTGRRTSR